VTTPAIAYLFSLEQFGIKFGLDNMRALVGALGHPERAYHVVHVAGTNGKGSVAAMVDAALRAAGHRTGRYTSPHLVDVSERFVVDGDPVHREALERAADLVRSAVERLLASGTLRSPPTFFEATTAVAWHLFRDAGVEVAVCEVGLGGRLDATNVVEPAVTAITSIGYDHQQYLGPTLPEIAAEKAGIIKRGVPVVLGAVPPEADAVIRRIAREREAPVVETAQPVAAEVLGWIDGAARLRVRTPFRQYGSLTLGLPGAHQVGNAAVAVRVLECLDEAGVAVPAEAVQEGLQRVVWPGRLDRRSLPDGREVLMDAAHNPEGAQALAAFLASEGGPPRVLVFGAMRDKDIPAMLRALTPFARAIVATRASNDRSMDPSELAAIAGKIEPSRPVYVGATPVEALATAWRIDPRIVVAGSIFLLGDVMKLHGWS